MDAGHTYAPADKRRDRIRVLGRSSFRTDVKVGNGTAQWSKPNRQRQESGLARRAKMLLQLPQELSGNAHRCRYTAEHFVGSVTCSRIEETTFPSSHIENPSGGSIRSCLRLAVAGAQNTRAPAFQAAPATPRQHTIWFSISSLESVPLCMHLKQQSPMVLQLFALLQGRLVAHSLTRSNHQFCKVCIMKLSQFRGSLYRCLPFETTGSLPRADSQGVSSSSWFPRTCATCKKRSEIMKKSLAKPATN